MLQTTRRTGDLRAARDAGHDGLVILSDENFTAFAMEGPRPYGMAIMFTAQAAKYNCKHCRFAWVATIVCCAALPAHTLVVGWHW